MENSSAAAAVCSLNHLPHHMACNLFIEDASTALQEVKESDAGRGPLQDHDVMVREVLPVQQLNDVRCAGAIIGKDCQADFQGNGSGMISLEERQLFTMVRCRWFPKSGFKTVLDKLLSMAVFLVGNHLYSMINIYIQLKTDRADIIESAAYLQC